MAKQRKPPTATGTALVAAGLAGLIGFWSNNWTAGAVAAALYCLLGVLTLSIEVRTPPPPPPHAIDPAAPETVALYRLFNDVGALLYIGISDTPKRRFQEHKSDKPWASQIDHWTVEWYLDRPRAAAAELQAIVREVPAYNSAGMPTSSVSVSYSRQLVERKNFYPSAYNLEELFLNYRRAVSLPSDAVRAWDPDEALRLYEYAKKRASGFVLRQHKRFVKEWNRELSERSQRREQERRDRLAGPSRG